MSKTKSASNFYQIGKYHPEIIKNGYKYLMETITFSKNGSLSVMDIGCGSGRVLNDVVVPVLPKNVSEIIGTDMDENMIEFCRSMNTNSKISFEILNISDEKIPNHLQNRFDLLFSSYCFSYVSNWRQAFMNCSRMMKPNGEIFLISQFKVNALYTTYRKMASMDRWKLYTKDYLNFISPLSSGNPNLELKEILQNEDVGMVPVKFKFDHDIALVSPKRDVLDVYRALDNIASTIPQKAHEVYTRDFIEILSQETDFTDENSLDDIVHFNFPTVFLHAKKTTV